MDISTHLTRRDLLVVGFKLQFRMRANLVFLMVVGCLSFSYSWYERGFDSLRDVVLAAFVAVVVGVSALLAGAGLGIVCPLLMTGKTPGVLGRHDFSISSAGLKEATDVNDSMHAWLGIREVIKMQDYLVLYNGMTAHAIPRRAFASQAQFNAFCEQAAAWWKAARALQPAAA